MGISGAKIKKKQNKRSFNLKNHILADKAPLDYAASTQITTPLVNEITQQGQSISVKENAFDIAMIRTNLQKRCKTKLESPKQQLSLSEERFLELAAEKGASNLLVTLPLRDQGFVLNRSEFMDAVNIRYHRQLKGVPQTCPCGEVFNITHAYYEKFTRTWRRSPT